MAREKESEKNQWRVHWVAKLHQTFIDCTYAHTALSMVIQLHFKSFNMQWEYKKETCKNMARTHWIIIIFERKYFWHYSNTHVTSESLMRNNIANIRMQNDIIKMKLKLCHPPLACNNTLTFHLKVMVDVSLHFTHIWACSSSPLSLWMIIQNESHTTEYHTWWWWWWSLVSSKSAEILNWKSYKKNLHQSFLRDVDIWPNVFFYCSLN